MNNIDGKIRGLIEKDLKSKSKRKYCSAKGLFGIQCSKRIIESHTLSKSGSLKTIMDRDRKVYGVNLSYGALEKNEGCFGIRKFGINEASTFLGFCSEHDKTLFSIFEDHQIIPTKEQMCLLSYRSICRELYTKENEADTRLSHSLVELEEFRKNTNIPYIKEMLIQRDTLLKIGLSEIKRTYGELNNIIENKDFHKLEYFIIELSSPASVLCSGAIVPDLDFNNRKLKNLFDINESAEHLFFNIINYDNRGLCVFSWIKKPETEYFYGFIRTLMQRKKRISDNLINFIFSYFENTFFSPMWWDRLTDVQKEKIENKIMEYDGRHNLCEHKVKNYNAFNVNIDKCYYLS